jgi:hypothetical protein
MTGPSTADLKIREATLGDYAQIAALNSRNGLGVKSREEWEHIWVNNPVYKKVPNWPIGWVAEIASEIVGFVGSIPVSYFFKGREITGASTHSLCIDPPYRGYMIYLAKRFLKYGWATGYCVDSSANANSYKLLDRLKIPRVPVGDWGNSVFWITDYVGFLESALGRKGLPKFLASPGAAVLKIRDRLVKPSSWRRQTMEVSACTGFDERFDRFWEELKRAYPNRFLSTRSREVLQWHFHYGLAQKRMWILAIRDASRIAAYAIFCRMDSDEIKLKRVRLVDFQVLDGNAQLLVPMLAWALRKCEEEGVHMLEAYGFRPDKQNVIDALAPYRRQLPSWFYFYTTRNKTLDADLRDPNVWDPSHFDGDASL